MSSHHIAPICIVPARPSTGLASRYASAFLRVSKRVFCWPGRVLQARREMALFASMSEHDLRDIGLTRNDVTNATALERYILPSAFLAQAIKSRHHRQRQ